ncbi:methyltransferase domain-containing protein [Colletotrichum tofieldiae]|nr:methyltransferase domain-containing protein [Colletotrichum tofieldiae]
MATGSKPGSPSGTRPVSSQGESADANASNDVRCGCSNDINRSNNRLGPEPIASIPALSEETPVGDPLEAGGTDDDDEFTPSVFDEGSIADDRTDSTSLNSSVYEHSFKNGRRYHKFRHGRYPIPNDETEQNREDMLHAMMLEVTDGRLYFAPIGDSPQKVIDLGTGTGIWAIESESGFPYT